MVPQQLTSLMVAVKSLQRSTKFSSMLEALSSLHSTSKSFPVLRIPVSLVYNDENYLRDTLRPFFTPSSANVMNFSPVQPLYFY